MSHNHYNLNIKNNNQNIKKKDNIEMITTKCIHAYIKKNCML